jgi:hypothetical protein
VSSRGKNCVVGKLIADHQVGKETIKKSLLRWWKISDTISFKVLGENLFLVEFITEEDKKRVLDGRPWGFEGGLFLIEDFDGRTSPSELTFEKAAFWIRMVGLPLACMGRETGRMLGSSVGEVEAVDTDANGLGWGESLRVKVLIDLTKPLARGRMLKIKGMTKWIAFQYERLPKFCFNCGIIIHGKTGCQKKTMMRQKEVTEYGLWLRAPSPPRRNDRGLGRNGSRRETSYDYQEEREEVRPSTAAGGGQARARGARGDDVDPNPKRSKSQKERREDLGANRGGVAEKYLARVQNVTENFQKDDYYGKKEMRSHNERRSLNRGSESPPVNALKKARFSPIKTGVRPSPKEICGALKENTWSNVEDSEEKITNHAPRREVFGFGGPRLADVERTVQVAKYTPKDKQKMAVQNNGDGIAEGEANSEVQGKRKKRDIDGELKERNCDANIGSGMAEAAEQPRRPQ